tara:strand:+ start:5620 stop:5982 length:363 start_codon:yes stop_codon:yes gene_type:complete
MARNETKLWRKFKEKTPNIIWTRIENSASFGTPDLLGYNKNNTFFTVEMKVIKRYFKFSPHQKSFHIRHPKNSFILAMTLEPCSVKLYEGSQILSLVSCTVVTKPLACDFDHISLYLDSL